MALNVPIINWLLIYENLGVKKQTNKKTSVVRLAVIVQVFQVHIIGKL